MSLARAAVRGAGATLAGQWGRLVLQLLSTMILARILTPGDYGLVGMVLAFTGLADRLKNMGLSTVTVQRRTIDQAQLSLLFWVNVALGLALAVIIAALAPAIAWFYGAPELTGIAIGLSTAFLFSGMASQHVALLNRRMQFGSLASIEIVVMVVSAVAAVTSGMLGAGYWALVLFHVVQPLVKGGLAWRRTKWIPSRPGRADDAREMLAFGANLSGFEVLGYITKNLDNVLIGRFIGAGQLGIYTKAYGLLLLPIQQIQGPVHRVAIPTLSRLQDEPDRFRRYFCTGLRSVAYVVIPFITFLAVAAEEVVLILLGDQWVEAIGVFRILAFAGIATAVSHSNGWLYIAMGRVRRQMVWALISSPVKIAAIVVGLRWGIEGVAAGYAIAVWLLLVPSFWNATHGTPVSMRDIARSVQRPAMVSSVAIAAALLVRASIPDAPVIASAASVGVAYALAAGACVAAWPRARNEVRDTVQLVRGGFSRTP